MFIVSEDTRVQTRAFRIFQKIMIRLLDNSGGVFYIASSQQRSSAHSFC